MMRIRKARRPSAAPASIAFGVGFLCCALFLSAARWQNKRLAPGDSTSSGVPCHGAQKNVSAGSTALPPPLPDLDTVPYIFFTFGTAAYFPMANNWARSLQAIGAPYLLAAFDAELMSMCRRHSLPCMLLPQPHLGTKNFRQGAPCMLVHCACVHYPCASPTTPDALASSPWRRRANFTAFRAMGVAKVRCSLLACLGKFGQVLSHRNRACNTDPAACLRAERLPGAGRLFVAFKLTAMRVPHCRFCRC